MITQATTERTIFDLLWEESYKAVRGHDVSAPVVGGPPCPKCGAGVTVETRPGVRPPTNGSRVIAAGNIDCNCCSEGNGYWRVTIYREDDHLCAVITISLDGWNLYGEPELRIPLQLADLFGLDGSTP